MIECADCDVRWTGDPLCWSCGAVGQRFTGLGEGFRGAASWKASLND